MILRSTLRAARALMPVLLPAVLASMACQDIGPQLGIKQGTPQPGGFLLSSVAYTLNAGNVTEEGSCDFDIGAGCPDSILDRADGPAASLLFGLETPTEAISSMRLSFYLTGSNSPLSGEVTATAETTLYSATGGNVYARVQRSVRGIRGTTSTTDDFALRIGAGGAPIAIPIGADFIEVTLPAGTSTVFADVHVTLSEAAGSIGDTDVTYVLEIVRDAPCKTDARCPAEQKCVRPAGVCTTGELGEDCADPQDCNTGFCYSGRCSDGSPGSLCTIDRDCQSYCANVHCQAGNDGDYCITAEQCNFEGAHCPQVFIGYGLCTGGDLSDYCVVDADCDEELDCNGGTCGP